ncbi:MAG: response regulator [Candidatus Hodarchaeales archaeon]|jgi:DNA-binding response OmpR family regulator
MRVLLVDDDENLLFMVKKFITRAEPAIELVGVISANKAINKLSKEHFDIVVSDYQMPDTNGLQLLAQLREKGNSIPFIMFTGRGSKEIANQALSLGADYYLRKNANLKDLYNSLAYAIRNVLLQRQIDDVHLAREDTIYLEKG